MINPQMQKNRSLLMEKNCIIMYALNYPVMQSRGYFSPKKRPRACKTTAAKSDYEASPALNPTNPAFPENAHTEGGTKT